MTDLHKTIRRTQPVQSQCARHKLALGPISPEEHHFARSGKFLTLRQTYFVDNVTTSGHTLEAARDLLDFLQIPLKQRDLSTQPKELGRIVAQALIIFTQRSDLVRRGHERLAYLLDLLN